MAVQSGSGYSVQKGVAHAVLLGAWWFAQKGLEAMNPPVWLWWVDTGVLVALALCILVIERGAAKVLIGVSLLVGISLNGYALVKPPSQSNATQPSPREKFRGVFTIETNAGPDVDVSKEQFQLDDVGAITLVPPYGDDFATLAFTLGRDIKLRGNVMFDRVLAAQTQEVKRGRPPATYKVEGRTFVVWLESSYSQDRAPDRHRAYKYTVRVREQ